MKISVFNIIVFLLCAQGLCAQNITAHGNVSDYDTAVYFLSEARKAKYASLDKTIENALLSVRYLNRFTGLSHDFHNENIHATEPDSVLRIRQEVSFLAARSYFAIANSIGLAVRNKNEYVGRSKTYFERYLRFSSFLDDQLATAAAYNELARIKSFERKYNEARQLYEKSHKLYLVNKYYTGMAQVQNNLGLLETLCGDTLKAWVDFQYAVHSAAIDSSKDVMSEGFLNLAGLCYGQGDYEISKSFLDSAAVFCGDNEILRCKIFLRYSQVYERQEDFRSAYYYRISYGAYRDGVLNSENLKQINELEGILKTDEQQAKIESLHEENNAQGSKLHTLEFTVAVLCILAAGFIVLIKKVVNRNRTVSEQNEKITRQNKMLEEYNDNINSSLTYASRLQRLIIRGSVDIHKILSDFFVLYQPKDVVSGDFYYVRDLGQRRVVAVADCTGHGVPAAFLSVLNITFLNEIFSYIDKFTEPEMVLELLKIKVVQTLNQSGDSTSSMDGMDIGIVIADKETKELKYAGAYIDLFVLKAENFEVQTIKADRNPIGWYHKEKAFKQTLLELDGDDVIYMFSDGYTDQINNKTEKFTKYRMRKIMKEFAPYSLDVQRDKYAENFNKWKNGTEQVDDVLLLGIRVKSLFEVKKQDKKS